MGAGLGGRGDVTTGGVVAIDGTAVRAARDRGSGALPMVCAWASRSCPVMGQEAVDQKSDKITAIPELLARLGLRGQVVTFDAMEGQKIAIAHRIVAQRGDYVLTVKNNLPDLRGHVADSFALAETTTLWQTRTSRMEKGHGRIEVWTSHNHGRGDASLAQSRWRVAEAGLCG